MIQSQSEHLLKNLLEWSLKCPLWFHRCIVRPRWGWPAHWRCVRRSPGGRKRHADPQRAVVHMFRGPKHPSLRPGGGCSSDSVWSLCVYGVSFLRLLITHSCFCICVLRVINVWGCSRVTALKSAVCWCLLLPLSIFAFILAPVIRPSAATVSR